MHTDVHICGKKKGQSVLLTHSILVSFAIFLVLAVFLALNTLRSDFQDFAADKEVRQSCILVRDAVEKIYVDATYRPPGNFTSGSILMRMPERIAGSSYRIRFENSSAVIDASPAFNTTCRIGLNLSYSGSSTGGLVQIKYIRYSNRSAIEASNP